MAGLASRSLLRNLVRSERQMSARGMATQETVSYAQYKSGEKTYIEFQNANRPYYVIVTYVTLFGSIWLLRRRSKRKAAKAAELEAAEKTT
ncbi:hypothetical protein NDN08_002499 [Rhodosorus marinus]|uniref:Uncharacterized protein n=1 Tax=Rhodosorus marinus TaxID=101924 RepID=A0AAV8UTX7_9RHOD|nr:hypothetical protein NDN08_002499 [Rhodosorus marinus]